MLRHSQHFLRRTLIFFAGFFSVCAGSWGRSRRLRRIKKESKTEKNSWGTCEVSFGGQMIFKTLCALATRLNTDPASIFQILTTLGKCAVKHFLWDTFTQGTQNLAPKKLSQTELSRLNSFSLEIQHLISPRQVYHDLFLHYVAAFNDCSRFRGRIKKWKYYLFWDVMRWTCHEHGTKKKLWVPDRNWTYELSYTGRML